MEQKQEQIDCRRRDKPSVLESDGSSGRLLQGMIPPFDTKIGQKIPILRRWPVRS